MEPPTFVKPSLDIKTVIGEHVTWKLAVHDNVPGPILTCSHNSGDIFPLGLTVVECALEDRAGNRVVQAFTIFVEGKKDCKKDCVVESGFSDNCTAPSMASGLTMSVSRAMSVLLLYVSFTRCYL